MVRNCMKLFIKVSWNKTMNGINMNRLRDSFLVGTFVNDKFVNDKFIFKNCSNRDKADKFSNWLMHESSVEGFFIVKDILDKSSIYKLSSVESVFYSDLFLNYIVYIKGKNKAILASNIVVCI